MFALFKDLVVQTTKSATTAQRGEILVDASLANVLTEIRDLHDAVEAQHQIRRLEILRFECLQVCLRVCERR